jgi:hypothetical protein
VFSKKAAKNDDKVTGLGAFEEHLPYQKYQGPAIVVRYTHLFTFYKLNFEKGRLENCVILTKLTSVCPCYYPFCKQHSSSSFSNFGISHKQKLILYPKSYIPSCIKRMLMHTQLILNVSSQNTNDLDAKLASFLSFNLVNFLARTLQMIHMSFYNSLYI